MNPFLDVRPRGNDPAPRAPRARSTTRPAGPQLLLDVNGRQRVALAPRATYFHVDSAIESKAQQDKRRKIIGSTMPTRR